MTEQVSTNLVKSCFIWAYSGYVNISDQAIKLVCLCDPGRSLVFIVVVHLVVLLAWVGMSDMAVLWLCYNLSMGLGVIWPQVEGVANTWAMKTPLLREKCDKKLN